MSNSEADSGSMDYGMLGKDRASESEKVEKYSGEVGWEYLKPHYEAGALYWADASLDLVAVGEAIARDDAEAVRGWLGSGDLVKIEEIHAAQWEGGSDQFSATVISPFVVMQAGK